MSNISLNTSSQKSADLESGRCAKGEGIGCFIAGTKVKTVNGEKNIEDIESGDYVLAENPETGEQEYKKVVRTYIHEKTTLVHVFIGKEEIKTTVEHPFYVEGIGFVSAGELRAGDIIRTSEGKNLPVDKVELEPLEEPVLVYNFEVEDFHTYYVSGLGVLVHNDCGADFYVGPDGTAAKSLKEYDSFVKGGSNTLLLDTSKHISGEVADHHIIPKFRGKSKPYADFISARGINVDDYTVTVSAGKSGMHMNLIHGSGGWNQKWMEFIDNNPNATAKDIYQFAGKMMDDYGLSGYTIHPYGKK